MPDDPPDDPSQTIASLRRELVALGAERDAALAREAALAEILQIINSSPGDPAPVFDAILEKATRLCAAACGQIATYDGANFRWVAVHGEAPFVAEQLARGPMPPSFGVTWPRIVGGEGVVNITDLRDTDLYRTGHEAARRGADIGGARSLLSVALRKENLLRGILTVYRQEVRPFTDDEIALLQNFAAQAVIAMENARLLTETREALAQQTATAEVLQVINSSPGDLAPVFDAMLKKAMRLCEAAFGFLTVYDGQSFRAAAERGVPAKLAEYFAAGIDQPQTGDSHWRLLGGEDIVHNLDQMDEAAYRSGNPLRRAAVDLGGVRSALVVALRKDRVLMGAFTLYRTEVRPFTDKQIALLQNFAAQAVIAMENARLLTETREALAQQTATAEVLQVINSSPGDLAPVFEAMLEKATRLCDASLGTLWAYDGERMHPLAMRGASREYAEYLSNQPLRPGAGALGSFVRGETILHVVDLKQTEAYRNGDTHRRALVDLGGGRALVGVPLRTDDQLRGAFLIYRREPQPFSDKQIALLRNFAAQAVIAMENARLLTETREALDQQTATTEVLQVINSSPGDLAPVFDAMLERATRLCEAEYGLLGTYGPDGFRGVAAVGLPMGSADALSRIGHPPPDTALGRVERTRKPVQIIDIAQEPAYAEVFRVNPWLRQVHSNLVVPLLKDGELVGVFILFRGQVRPFTDKQIALLQNFAAQAVIAMENARLLTETREALEYQTATSDVLKVISRSTFDLEPVLENVIDTAIRLCRAHMGSIFRLKDGRYRWAVGYGLDPAYREIEMRTPLAPDSGTLVGRTARAGRAVQIADALVDPLYAVKDEAALTRARTMLGVPLLREGTPIGVIAMARDRVEPFNEKEIALVTTFADQAVIAIENARLFNELHARTAELGRSVGELQMLNEVA
ncbi:MAG: GAF domain-containing protein, partial [Casimicrobiaceae bacterium]